MPLYNPAAAASSPILPILRPAFDGATYHGPAGGPWNNDTTQVQNRLHVMPFFNGLAGTVTKIGVKVTTAVASSHARLGIYNNDATRNLPGTLLLDAGVVNCNSAVEVTNTISQALAANTWYWLACVLDLTGLSLTMWYSNVAGFGISSLLPTGNLQIYRAFTYAALPADESAQAYTIASGGACPLVFLK